MNVCRCFGVDREERSPSRAMVGESGMLRLRITDRSLMTSDQNCLTGGQFQNAWWWLSVIVGQYVQVLVSVRPIRCILWVVMCVLCNILY